MDKECPSSSGQYSGSCAALLVAWPSMSQLLLWVGKSSMSIVLVRNLSSGNSSWISFSFWACCFYCFSCVQHIPAPVWTLKLLLYKPIYIWVPSTKDLPQVFQAVMVFVLWFSSLTQACICITHTPLHRPKLFLSTDLCHICYWLVINSKLPNFSPFWCVSDRV